MPWSISKRDGKFCVIKDSDGSTEKCHDTEDAAKAHVRALYSSENRALTGPVESRAAEVSGVDFPQRTIDVLAVPYDQEALVEYHPELWMESFERGAFDGINDRPEQYLVQAFRDHAPGESRSGTNTSGLIGRVTRFDPEAEAGLLASVKVAKTATGDETLQLADEGV